MSMTKPKHCTNMIIFQMWLSCVYVIGHQSVFGTSYSALQKTTFAMYFRGRNFALVHFQALLLFNDFS